MAFLIRFDRSLGALLRGLPVACLVALFVILAGNVVSRYYQIWSIAWFDEIVEALFAWMVFVGAAALWREHEHFRVGWLPERIAAGWPRRAHGLLLVLIDLGFLGVMTWQGMNLTLNSGALTPILRLPTALAYACVPLAGAVMLAYSLVDLLRILRPSGKDPA